MGMNCCDNCWERPCVCGHEAREKAKFRTEFYASYGRKTPEEGGGPLFEKKIDRGPITQDEMDDCYQGGKR